MSELKLGIDIGGTFTDFALLDPLTGELEFGKVLTNADDPAQGVLDGLEAFEQTRRLGGGQKVSICVHGTTLVSNAIIERKGAKTALLTTKGFRDVLTIARELRYDLYNLFARRPEPLVPPVFTAEVTERVDADGRILTYIDESEVTALLRRLVDEHGVESVGVVLLHSHASDQNERKVREIQRRLFPHVAVSLSTEVVGEIREYERASTTVANAYVQPLVERYLNRLTGAWEVLSGSRRFFVMVSNGGATTVDHASQYPVKLVGSGAAAGVLSGAFFGQVGGYKDVIAFDMGGTTAKASLVKDGVPRIGYETEVARIDRFKKGSGLPIKVPTVDLIEVGAGGGSIAVVDGAGLLRVGPMSAGAAPGPACYGLGGRLPTVTDADLVLGYLNPDYFLGGRMHLDVQAARRAIQEHLARPLGVGVEEAAWGIHAMVNENMAMAIRVHIAERGEDPRRFALVATGGAGPTHAYHLARKLGIPRVLCPPGAGVGSSIGLLVAPPTIEFAVSYPQRLGRVNWERASSFYAGRTEEGRRILREMGVAEDTLTYQRLADMRYAGQGYELTIEVPEGVLGAGTGEALVERFEAQFAKQYGRTIPNVPIEVITWRLVLRGPTPEFRFRVRTDGQRPVTGLPKGSRSVYLARGEPPIGVPVYDRYALAPGTALKGPAILEEEETTIFVGPDAIFTLDDHMNVLMQLEGSGVDPHSTAAREERKR